MKASDTIRIGGLTKIKADLDGGFLYLFAGPVPADEGVALDMATQHTEIAKLSVNGDGVTGLTFATPAAGVILKTAAQDWEATTAFDGFADASPSLTPTFARFCTAADNGRASSALSRLQLTVGGNGSGAEIVMTAAPYSDGAAIELKAFSVTGDN